MRHHALRTACIDQNAAKTFIERMAVCHMDDDVIKKRVRTKRRPVNDLIRHTKMFRLKIQPEASHRRECDDPEDTDVLQCPDVGAVWHLRRVDAMPLSMPRQKRHPSSLDFCNRNFITRLTERRIDIEFLNDTQSLDLREPAATDDRDLSFDIHLSTTS